MKMKRIISLLLCVLLTAAFCAGCSFSSGKDEKAPDAPASDTAPADDAAAPSQEAAPSGDAEPAEKPAEPAGTDWPDTSEDTSLPEIEIPFEEDMGDELIDPDELAGDSQSSEPSGTEDPGFVPEEDLITDNPDLQVDENGDTLLPEIED